MKTPAQLLLSTFFACSAWGLATACSSDSSSSDDPGGAGAAASGGSAGSAGAATAGAAGSGGTAGSVASGGAAGSSAGGTASGGSGGSLKVALIGDQGIKQVSRNVLQLIKNEGADFVIHVGDFDYEDNPDAWEELMNEGLGDLPWFAVAGNHDMDRWTDYAAVIQRKLDKMSEPQCAGEPGIQHSCSYKGVRIVMIAQGLRLPASGIFYPDYLETELGNDDSNWRFCIWHKNQADMQLGGKDNEIGWPVFHKCQKYGAMIVNGHEHSYSRTYTLTDVGNAENEHGWIGTWNELTLGLGKTIVMVSGSAGQSLRTYYPEAHDDDTWWASGYTANRDIKDGVRSDPGLANQLEPGLALFIELGVDGDPTAARGYMKTVSETSATDGRLMDEFTIDLDPSGFGAPLPD